MTFSLNTKIIQPEKNNEIPKKALGICSDCIVNYKHIHTEK